METLNRKNFLKLLGVSSLAMLSSKTSAGGLFNAFEDKKLSPTPLRLAHLTDIHIQSGLESEKGFASCLHAVNGQKPDLILNGGDAIMNEAFTFSKEKVKKQWELFHKMMVTENSLPVNHCIGNHDLYGWAMPSSSSDESKLLAMDEYQIKKPYYAMQHKKWKFIVLDSIRPKNSVPGYYAQLDDEQLVWLKAELESTPKDIFICIVSHVPILAVCTFFEGGNKNKKTWSIPNNSLHADAGELTALFYQYPNVKACLSGHIHMIDHVNYLGVDYYCNGAVSGGWWKGNHHQFPPSFSMMNFFDDGKVTRDVNYYNWNLA
jgi:Icc protein